MATDNSTYRPLFHSLIQHIESEMVEHKKTENNFYIDTISKLGFVNGTFCVLKNCDLSE